MIENFPMSLRFETFLVNLFPRAFCHVGTEMRLLSYAKTFCVRNTREFYSNNLRAVGFNHAQLYASVENETVRPRLHDAGRIENGIKKCRFGLPFTRCRQNFQILPAEFCFG